MIIMYDTLTKNRYYIVKYQKGLIMYTDPIRINLSLIDLSKFDDEAYKAEVKKVFSLTEFDMDILGKLKPLETQTGGGAVWSKGIMLINPDEQNVIDQRQQGIGITANLLDEQRFVQRGGDATLRCVERGKVDGTHAFVLLSQLRTGQ
jgi:hypothetical protein